MPSIRILVFGLPALVGDLVRLALDAEDDITTVSARRDELDRALAELPADAIVVPLTTGGLPAEISSMFAERIRVPVLGIGARDGQAVLFQLRPERTELGEVSAAELPALLRRALARDTTF